MSRLTSVALFLLFGSTVVFFQGCTTCSDGDTGCTCGTTTQVECKENEMCTGADGVGVCKRSCKNGETECSCGTTNVQRCSGDQICAREEGAGVCKNACANGDTDCICGNALLVCNKNEICTEQQGDGVCKPACGYGGKDCTCGTIKQVVCVEDQLCIGQKSVGVCRKACSNDGKHCVCGTISFALCHGGLTCSQQEGHGVCSSGSTFSVRQAIGTAILASEVNILAGEISGGRRVFNVSRCVAQQSEIGTTKQSEEQMETKEDIMTQVNLQYSGSASMLDSNGNVATATINSQFGQSYNSYKFVKAIKFDKKNVVERHTLRLECKDGSLVHHTVHDAFMNLPADIPSVLHFAEWKQAWNAYEEFLRKIGSHVITQVESGARIQTWMMDSSNDDNSETNIKSQACLAYQTMTNDTNIEICAGVDISNAQSISTTNFHTKIVTMGGNASLASSLRPENVESAAFANFIQQARINTVIDVKLAPIWSFLKEFDAARANNLKKCANEFYETLDLPLCNFFDRPLQEECRCGEFAAEATGFCEFYQTDDIYVQALFDCTRRGAQSGWFFGIDPTCDDGQTKVLNNVDVFCCNKVTHDFLKA